MRTRINSARSTEFRSGSRFLQAALAADFAGWWLMVLVFVISLFGFVFGARIMHELIARDLIAKEVMTKIGTAYLLVVIFLAISLPRARFSMWIAVFLPLFLAFAGIVTSLRQRSVRFRNDFVEALAIVALKMKSGRSFRQAYSEVCAESPPNVRAKLSEIGSYVVFSQQKRPVIPDRFVAEVIAELTRIDQQPHAAGRRLAVFRDKLRVEDDFRRRSGQALARARAQSLVMCGLYLALAIFMTWRFGLHGNERLFSTSAIFFAIGTIWMWRGGKRMKWKV